MLNDKYINKDPFESQNSSDSDIEEANTGLKLLDKDEDEYHFDNCDNIIRGFTVYVISSTTVGTIYLEISMKALIGER